MRNKLHYAFILCLILIVSLLFLSLIPEFTIGTWRFKKIDIIADIQPDDPVYDSVIAVQDSVFAKADSIVKKIAEHCRAGITCIEDYSADSTALKYFLESLRETKQGGQPTFIAFYGDSFIEGDVFCGGFRDTLQSVFGGRGVGFVPITSDVTGFRNTIKHSFENWNTVSLLTKKDSTAIAIGPAGFSFIPQEDNELIYKASKQRYLREFNTVKLYYRNTGHAAVEYKIDNNDTLQFAEDLKRGAAMHEWKYAKPSFQSIGFHFYPYDSLYVYGASFESARGVYVDNFSMRGNSGLNLNGISTAMYHDFNQYRNYKLVILQFGLNIIAEDILNYQAYTKKMVKVVNKLKSAMPHASILLLSVGDRSSNKNGRFVTMAAVPALRNAQRNIARETGIAFWDMYEGMGGENSMVKLVETDPAMAAKDYTHINFKGGKKLGGLLARSLLYELEKYEAQ